MWLIQASAGLERTDAWDAFRVSKSTESQLMVHLVSSWQGQVRIVVMLSRVAASLNSVSAFETSDPISALFIWNNGGVWVLQRWGRETGPARTITASGGAVWRRSTAGMGRLRVDLEALFRRAKWTSPPPDSSTKVYGRGIGVDAAFDAHSIAVKPASPPTIREMGVQTRALSVAIMYEGRSSRQNNRVFPKKGGKILEHGQPERPPTDRIRVHKEYGDGDIGTESSSRTSAMEAQSFGRSEDAVRQEGGQFAVENAIGVYLDWTSQWVVDE
ncbi:hypothetical protein BJV74DRAFT_925775 [Russula compacta]|nr:hypothetical protein BJV74DRAFT_925775 [Russula compacta]